MRQSIDGNKFHYAGSFSVAIYYLVYRDFGIFNIFGILNYVQKGQTFVKALDPTSILNYANN